MRAYIHIIIFFLLITASLVIAKSEGNGFSTIIWDPVTTDINGDPETGTIYYYIYCQETLSYPPLQSEIVGTTTNAAFVHYDDRLLDPEVTLYYTVTAVDEFGNESPLGEEHTLPVELSSFELELLEGKVQVEWNVHSEQDMLGYNVLRSETKDGSYKKINTHIIQSSNSTTLKQYSFIDEKPELFKTYYYKLLCLNIDGTTQIFGPQEILVDKGLPETFLVAQNYPNPFNPVTTIMYALPEASPVHISIFNLQGKHVATLVDAEKPAGTHAVSWSGLNDNHIKVASGVYFYKMSAPGFKQVKKMIITK